MIKCKAWDEANKGWVTYGFCLRFDADGNYEVLNAFAQPFTDRKIVPVLFANMQDKHNKDVYVGDIVKAVLLDDYGNDRKEVIEEVGIHEGLLAPFYMRVRFEEAWWKDCLEDGFEVV